MYVYIYIYIYTLLVYLLQTVQAVLHSKYSLLFYSDSDSDSDSVVF